MTKLGTKNHPIVSRVNTEEKAMVVVEICKEHGWQYIVGCEPEKPDDISDLEKMLNPVNSVLSGKIKRNSVCPCGSGKKYKKCCG
jgi:SWIM/SEC-C metal-binding protein